MILGLRLEFVWTIKFERFSSTWKIYQSLYKFWTLYKEYKEEQ